MYTLSLLQNINRKPWAASRLVLRGESLMPEELRHSAPFNPSAHDNAGDGPPKPSPVPYKEYLLRLGSAAAQERSWRAVLTSVAFVSLITIGGLWAAPIAGAPNLIIVYVLAVVFSALRWGRRAAVFSAIWSAFLFDYFFIPPYRSFVSTDLWYLITLIGLLALGLLVSLLLSAAQKEAQEARTREAYTAALYSLTASWRGQII